MYLSIFQKHGATSSDMSKNEEEMLLPSEENIIMEEEFYPSATYARGQRNTTAGKSDCRVSSSGMFRVLYFCCLEGQFRTCKLRIRVFFIKSLAKKDKLWYFQP